MEKPKRSLASAPLLWLALAGILAGSFADDAGAFRLTPMLAEFAPAGRGASQSFELVNDSDASAAVQVSMLTRDMAVDGTESNAPADDDFLVYPAQVVLKPGQTQTVRVKWVGADNPAKELSFRILAEELPVNLTKPSAGSDSVEANISVLMRYLGSVYVVPKGAKPDLVLLSVTRETDAKGQRKLVLDFENRGTAHGMLRGLRLKLQAEGKTLELEGAELPGVAGENILASHRRRFALPWPAALPDGPVQGSFVLDDRH